MTGSPEVILDEIVELSSLGLSGFIDRIYFAVSGQTGSIDDAAKFNIRNVVGEVFIVRL